MAAGYSMRGLGLLVLGVLMISPSALPQEQRPLNLMPVPSSVQIGSGHLVVGASFTVGFTGYTEPRLDRAAQRFLVQLSRETGIPLVLKPGAASTAVLVIHTDHASKEIQELGEDESYSLEVSSAGAKLTAPNPLGILHGCRLFFNSLAFRPMVSLLQPSPSMTSRGFPGAG
jgi:hexosaminidase